jgi:hypothetical protein
MAEQICDNCKKANPADELYCYACGHILPAGLRAYSTQALPDSEALKPQVRWGTAYFGDQTILRIHVRSYDEIIETRFERECIIGRAFGNIQPDVDLGPYGAMDKGVSRQHVKLIRQHATVMVEDLDSANGTYLNGQKIVPHQPRVLRNEDELCLGHLLLRVSFMHTGPYQG